MRITASVFGFGFIAIALAGDKIIAALDDRRQAIALGEVASAREQLAAAGIALSFERSLTQVSLALPERPPEALRTLLRTARGAVDQGMSQVNDAVLGLTTSSQIAAFRDRRAAWATRRAEARAQADALLGREGAARDPAAVEGVVETLKRATADIAQDILLLRGPGYTIRTEQELLERLADSAMRLREFAGRERTYLVIAAATGRPLTEAQRQTIAE